MTTPDPFAGGAKTPSVSFKDVPVGTSYTMTVTEPADLVQSRNFDTDEPDFWDAAKTQPKMSAVVKGTVAELGGEERAFWAQKPSSLFAAIAEAQKTAGVQIAPGGTLTVQWFDSEANKDPKKASRKLYRAHYTPPNVFAQEAPAAAAPPAPADFPPAAAPAPQPVAAGAAPPWQQ